MAEAKQPGGVYLDAQGNEINANGKPLQGAPKAPKPGSPEEADAMLRGQLGRAAAALTAPAGGQVVEGQFHPGHAGPVSRADVPEGSDVVVSAVENAEQAPQVNEQSVAEVEDEERTPEQKAAAKQVRAAAKTAKQTDKADRKASK